MRCALRPSFEGDLVDRPCLWQTPYVVDETDLYGRTGQLPWIGATWAYEWRTEFRLVSLEFRGRGNRLIRARFRHQGGEEMTQGALSSLPPSFSPRGGLADEVHRAAYLMQGRIPQIRRALAAVRQRILASDARIKPTKDAWLGAVQDAMTGPPLDVQPALFKRVLGEWIAGDLFGLDDPTAMPEGDRGNTADHYEAHAGFGEDF